MPFRIESDTSQLRTDLLAVSTLSQQLRTDIKDVKIAFADFSTAGDLVSAKLQQVSSDGRIFVSSFKSVSGVMREVKQDFVGLQAPISGISGEFLRFLGFRFAFKELGILFSAFKDGIKDAAELSRRIVEIQTISQGTNIGGETEITSRVQKIAAETGRSSKDVAEATYQAISSGATKGADALNLVANSADFARATVTPLSDAVKVLTATMNSNELTTTDLTRIQGVLFSMVQQGSLRLSDLTGVMGRLGTIGHTVGVSLEEQGAALTVITQRGIDAHTAGTFLVNVFTALEKPSQALKKIFQDTGVTSAREFIDAMGGLQGVLAKVTQEVSNNNHEWTAAFPNIRGLTGVTVLASDGFKKYNEILESTKHGSEDLAKATKLMADNMGVEVEKLINRVQVFKESFGGDFLKGLQILGGKGLEALGAGETNVSPFQASDKAIDKAASEAKLEVEKKVNDLYAERLKAIRSEIIEKQTSLEKSKEEVATLKDSVKAAFGANVLDAFKHDIQDATNQIHRIDTEIDAMSKREAQRQGSRGVDETIFSSALKFEDNTLRKIELIKQEYQAVNQQQKTLEATGTPDSLKEAEKLQDKKKQLLTQYYDLDFQYRKQAVEAYARTPQGQLDAQLNGPLKVITDMLPQRQRYNELEIESTNLAARKLKLLNEQKAILEESQRAEKESLSRVESSFKEINKLTVFDKGGSNLKSKEDLGKILPEFDKQQEIMLKQMSGDPITMIAAQGQLAILRRNLEKDVQDSLTKIAAEGNQNRLENEKKVVADKLKTQIELQDRVSKTAGGARAVGEVGENLQTYLERRGRGIGDNDRQRIGKELKSLKDAVADTATGDLTPEKLKAVDDAALLLAKDLRAINVNLTEMHKGGVGLVETYLGKTDPKAIEQFLENLILRVQDMRQVMENKDAFKDNPFKQITNDVQSTAEQMDRVTKGGPALAASITGALSSTVPLSAALAANWTTVAEQMGKISGNGNPNFVGPPTPPIGGYAEGGMVYGSPGIDTNLAALTSGEYVVNAGSTSKFFSQLEAINAGRAPETGSSNPTSSTSVGDINVTVQQGSTQEQTARNIGYALRREIRRKTLTFD